MKVLNLDQIAEKQERREIHLRGKTYAIHDMTVENYIETTLAAEKLGDDATAIEQIEATVAMVKRSVPSLPEELLRSLPLEQLRILVAFVRGEDVEEDEKSAAQAQAQAEGSGASEGK